MTNFHAKVVQKYIADFNDYFEKYHLKSTNCCWYFWATFEKFWATFLFQLLVTLIAANKQACESLLKPILGKSQSLSFFLKNLVDDKNDLVWAREENVVVRAWILISSHPHFVSTKSKFKFYPIVRSFVPLLLSYFWGLQRATLAATFAEVLHSCSAFSCCCSRTTYVGRWPCDQAWSYDEDLQSKSVKFF